MDVPAHFGKCTNSSGVCGVGRPCSRSDVKSSDAELPVARESGEGDARSADDGGNASASADTEGTTTVRNRL
jgi:hypothetical protein